MAASLARLGQPEADLAHALQDLRALVVPGHRTMVADGAYDRWTPMAIEPV